MHPATEKRIAAQISKMLAMMCVRNTFLEEIHSGKIPETKTGDYSDVKVIDAEGTEIPWNEVSKITDAEMKIFMKQVVNRLYSWHLKPEELAPNSYVGRLFHAVQKYDEPELDEGFLNLMAQEFVQE